MSKFLILGCSPYIKEIKDFSFTRDYKTIAVNRFDRCKVDYRCAYDSQTIIDIENKKLEGLKIYNKHAVARITVGNLLILNKRVEISSHYLFKYSPHIVTEESGRLYGSQSSAIPAINYAILQGAKEVYLIGVDFNWSKGYYYNPIKQHKPGDKILELRKDIKQLRHYVNIYRVNPDNTLLLSFLPLKRIEEL